MAEWLIEDGIGEKRALLVANDEVLAAKLRWPGELAAGHVTEAQLTSKHAGSQRGVAIDAQGTELLVDRIPSDISEGSTISLLVTRAPIAERGRLKRGQARLASQTEPGDRSESDVFEQGQRVHRFPSGLWEEIWTNAWQAEVAFPGGSLLFATTPAMTVVDIDGDLPPRELALAAVPALAKALRQFDLRGSIGVDFPTLASKVDRKAVDSALEEALADWPHERTAMNGFGFVQLVARLEGPSLLHRMDTSRVGAAARMMMRRAEMVEEPGALLLTVHPAIKAKLKSQWLEELARRTGREVRIATDPALALDGGFAQAVT